MPSLKQTGTQSLINVKDAKRGIRWGQWIIRIIVTLVVLQLAWFLITNPNFDWPVVAAWFVAPTIMKGLWTTLWLSAVSMVIGIVLGTFVALMRMSQNALLRALSALYVWVFRGTPLLVQLILWYNLAALMPQISVGLPFGGPQFVSWSTNSVITPITAAILGLSLNETAFMAEIIRGGILSVPQGQSDAAKAFGMTPARTLTRIVLPQAMRSILPPTGNQVISMVKATSMVSVIAMSDILYTVQTIYNQTFQTIPMLFVAVIWYLIINSILSVAQSFIEYHYARGQQTANSFAGLVMRNLIEGNRRAAGVAGSQISNGGQQ